MICRALLLMTLSSAAVAADLPRCDKTLKFVRADPGDHTTIEHMPEGTVLLEFTVDERGKVTEPRVLESTNKRLERLALESAATWHFAPPKTKCRHRAPISFRVK